MERSEIRVNSAAESELQNAIGSVPIADDRIAWSTSLSGGQGLATAWTTLLSGAALLMLLGLATGFARRGILPTSRILK